MRLAGLMLPLLLALPAASLAFDAEPRLPAALAVEAPGLKRFSEVRFVKYLFHVYDAALWTPGARWSPREPYALEIRYAIGVTAADLARRSVEEMRAQGVGDEARLAAWEAQMRRVFPDIRPGDRLVGLALPGREARFYAGERLAGVVADGDFTDAFFAIWLGERSREPQMRRSLLRLP